METEVGTYKKIGETYEGGLFHNYILTELMLLKKNGRKKTIANSHAVYLLLSSKLTEYGIYIFGTFYTGDMEFRHIGLMKGFPIENEPILKQLYGYTNMKAHIHLDAFDSYAAAFDYDVETGECELQQHCWGTVRVKVVYKTLAEMLSDISNRGFDEIFKD